MNLEQLPEESDYCVDKSHKPVILMADTTAMVVEGLSAIITYKVTVLIGVTCCIEDCLFLNTAFASICDIAVN